MGFFLSFIPSFSMLSEGNFCGVAIQAEPHHWRTGTTEGFKLSYLRRNKLLKWNYSPVSLTASAGDLCQSTDLDGASVNESYPQPSTVDSLSRLLSIDEVLRLADSNGCWVRSSLTLHCGGMGFFTCCPPIGIWTDPC